MQEEQSNKVEGNVIEYRKNAQINRLVNKEENWSGGMPQTPRTWEVEAEGLTV